MEQELGLSKSQLGLFLTMHGLLYGVSNSSMDSWAIA